MCNAPNVYMFVHILIGTHMVPLIFIARMSHSYKPSQLWTWHREHMFKRTHRRPKLTLPYLFIDLFRSEILPDLTLRKGKIGQAKLGVIHVILL